jgi:hypothetical protein
MQRTQLQTDPLGRTGLATSRAGLWAIGGGRWELRCGPEDDVDAGGVAAIEGEG